MNTTMPVGTVIAPHKVLENVRPTMAKADLKNLEKAGRQVYGRVLERAIQIAGLSMKEACARLGEVVEGGQALDAGQVSRWFSGDENPQVWRFHADRDLRIALRVAEAEDSGDAIVRTVIEFRRLA